MNKIRTGESLKDLFKQEASSKELKTQDAKTLKRQRAQASKSQKAKEEKKKKYTIYLSPEQRKKLRLYAAKNDKILSEVMGELIDKNL